MLETISPSPALTVLVTWHLHISAQLLGKSGFLQQFVVDVSHAIVLEDVLHVSHAQGRTVTYYYCIILAYQSWRLCGKSCGMHDSREIGTAFRMSQNLSQKHGFCCGRNSIDSVIDLVTSVENDRRCHHITTAPFLNMKGAFDRAILDALSKIGIAGHLFEWMWDYLWGRSIFVSNSGGNSPQYTVSRGVPREVFSVPHFLT